MANHFPKKIKRTQELLQEKGFDGWLLYDFRRSNPLAGRFLEISPGQNLTRRFFYWIPVKGDPVKIFSSVENPLRHLPGKEKVFRSWQELHQVLKETIQGKVAMEFSPLGATPEVSRVDGGTIDLVRQCAKEVVSSGDLLQEFTTVWDDAKWQSHQRAAGFLDKLAAETWNFIRASFKGRAAIDEYQVQKFMLDAIEKRGFWTDHAPICAVNAHSADPHYEAPFNGSSKIKPGDFILIDLWCKENRPGATFGDITRMGVAAKKASDKQEEVFQIVKNARNKALDWIEENYKNKKPMRGFQVDRICRDFIDKAGYGNYFVHRTGHNIDETGHGPGAHIDDLETHDERVLLPETCFSIEPGIYLPGEFGVRMECDVFLSPLGKVIVTGGKQEEIESLL